MFGERKLEEHIDTLQDQLQEFEVLRPYLEIGRAIQEEHQRQLLEDPSELKEDALETAITIVRERIYRQERDRLAVEIYERVAAHETPKILAEVEREEREKLEAEAIARFEAERQHLASTLKNSLGYQLREEVRQTVLAERRAALEAQVKLEETERLRAEAEAEFERRIDSERASIVTKVAKQIAELTSEQRREALTAIERENTLRHVVKRDEIKAKRETAELEEEVRVQRIVEKARTARRIDTSDLKAGELLAVALAYREEVTRDVVPKQQRVLYFTVVDPAAGTLLLTRDNWIAEKDPIRRSLALPDGDIYEAGTKQRSGQVSSLAHVLRRSLPLTLKSEGTEVVPVGINEELEISQIFLGGNLTTLLMKDRDRVGNRTPMMPTPVDTDLFALPADAQVAYKLLV